MGFNSAFKGLTGSKHRLTRFAGFGLSDFYTTRTSVMKLDCS